VAQAIETARAGFVAGLEDDLNIAEALAAVFELVKSVNISMAGGKLGGQDAGKVTRFINEIDAAVLACLTDKPGAGGAAADIETWVREKIEARQKARASKDFKLADEIRQELAVAGIVLEDTKDGLRWKRVRPPKP
jgi:cysteinyl-tRNA synthetase